VRESRVEAPVKKALAALLLCFATYSCGPGEAPQEPPNGTSYRHYIEPRPKEEREAAARRRVRQKPLERGVPEIYVSACCGVETLLTDPAGNATGYDPDTGSRVEGIPNTYYEESSPLPEGRDTRLQHPEGGDYSLKVTGQAGSAYSLHITHAFSPASRTFQYREIPLGSDGTDARTLSVRASDPLQLGVSGLTPGLLTLEWKAVGSRQVTQEPELVLRIRYGEGIRPETLTAALGKRNLADLFHPRPGTAETVRIPLTDDDARSSLSLGADGRIGAVDASEHLFVPTEEPP